MTMTTKKYRKLPENIVTNNKEYKLYMFTMSFASEKLYSYSYLRDDEDFPAHVSNVYLSSSSFNKKDARKILLELLNNTL